MRDTIYSQVLNQIRENRSIAVKTVFSGEKGNLKGDLSRCLVSVETEKDRRGVSHAKVGYVREEGVTTITEPVFPRERLIILGGGHIGKQLCEMAVKCGFCVYVCDDRPSFANTGRFPGAEKVLCDSFENCLRTLQITPYDYAVIVTRGHFHDGKCLREILSGAEPAYTGLIGSRKRVGDQFDQLEREGFSRERMERVCTPVGLDIGAVTPEEIAVSILAELISYRRLPIHTEKRPCRDSDLTPEIVEYLAENDQPKAVVTVIASEGSTPRRAGAKMAVDPQGKTVGTIGGGRGEAAAIREAVGLIGTGRYQVCSFDLTGDVAKDEGMACGGKMVVLIEDGGGE